MEMTTDLSVCEHEKRGVIMALSELVSKEASLKSVTQTSAPALRRGTSEIPDLTNCSSAHRSDTVAVGTT